MFLTLLQIIQVISGLLLVIFILAQQRGAGLGSVAGGSGGNQVFTSRRGVERIIFNITIILTVIFVASSIGTYLI